MFHMKPLTTSQVRTTTLAIAAAFAVHGAAHGQRSASEVSEASLVPVAISVALPVVLVAGSIRLAGGIASAAGMAIGTVIVVTVVATGTVLSAAGHVIAFIPNEIGRTLSYNQRVSR
jgi:hypothetical protein